MTRIVLAPYPARSAFEADGLALVARVEVECVAAVPETSDVNADDVQVFPVAEITGFGDAR
jgi:hypothetical protein